MSDSNRPSNKIFARIRKQLERVNPTFQGFIAIGKLWDGFKKGVQLLWDIINNPIGYFVAASLAAAGILPPAVTKYLDQKRPPPEVAAPKNSPTAEPKALVPVIPEKPQPTCTSISLAKLRAELSGSATRLEALKRYHRSAQCGWVMAVVDVEPRDGGWRVTLERDGVRVFAEIDWRGGIRPTDFAHVSGSIEAVSFDHDHEVVVLTLRRARVQRQ